MSEGVFDALAALDPSRRFTTTCDRSGRLLSGTLSSRKSMRNDHRPGLPSLPSRPLVASMNLLEVSTFDPSRHHSYSLPCPIRKTLPTKKTTKSFSRAKKSLSPSPTSASLLHLRSSTTVRPNLWDRITSQSSQSSLQPRFHLVATKTRKTKELCSSAQRPLVLAVSVNSQQVSRSTCLAPRLPSFVASRSTASIH